MSLQNRLTDTDNKFMVTLGGGEEGYLRNSGLADTLVYIKQVSRPSGSAGRL